MRSPRQETPGNVRSRCGAIGDYAKGPANALRSLSCRPGPARTSTSSPGRSRVPPLTGTSCPFLTLEPRLFG